MGTKQSFSFFDQQTREDNPRTEGGASLALSELFIWAS